MDKEAGISTAAQRELMALLKDLQQQHLEPAIRRIVKEEASDQHSCRYSIPPPELEEAMRFFKNINGILEESKKTIRKTFLVIIITGICGLVCLGFWAKIKGAT